MAQRISLLAGDCVERMAAMPDSSFGAIVCDPPYLIGFGDWDVADDPDDDGPGIAGDDAHAAWLAQAFRLVRPGGLVIAMAAPRTMFLLAHALTAAGFVDVRLRGWTFLRSFPKGLDLARAIDKELGVLQPDMPLGTPDQPISDEARQWAGWATNLKSCWEPVLVARRP